MLRSVLFFGFAGVTIVLLFASLALLQFGGNDVQDAGIFGIYLSLVTLTFFMMMPFPNEKKSLEDDFNETMGEKPEY